MQLFDTLTVDRLNFENELQFKEIPNLEKLNILSKHVSELDEKEIYSNSFLTKRQIQKQNCFEKETHRFTIF